MKKLRILVPSYIPPDRKSATIILFENLLPVLNNKIDVEMVWFVYQPEKLDLSLYRGYDYSVLDIHDYHDAVDVVRKVKPDMIYANATWDLIDYAFSSAGKFLQIPVVSEFYSSGFVINRSKTTLIKSIIKRFFENSIPTDTDKSKKQSMRRGRFFVYKYLFLLKTLRATKMNRLKVFATFFLILKLALSDKNSYINSRFANTLHWVENKILAKQLVDAGFDKSSIEIVGSPMYDIAFQRISKWKTSEKQDGSKIRVLLVTTALYEHGIWTRQQRDQIIKDIVSIISKHHDKISFVIKIHPSSEILTEYESIVHSIDDSIPVYQQGDILDYLEKSDVVMSFSAGSVLLYALIARKPIVICNFNNNSGDIFIERGLALECKTSSEIIQAINAVLASNPAEGKIDNFIEEFVYKSDGLASERLSNAIMKLFEKNDVTIR